jgi:urease accessory protein
MTRPFRLDRAIPAMLTVYQQSSSGGLYRGESLSTRLTLGAASAVHVTTQAATVVHDCHGQAARQSVQATIDDDAYLALTPDPQVLFPGASSQCATTIRMNEGAVLLLAEAFTFHDPEQLSRPFAHMASLVRIEDHAGRLRVRDAFRLSGEAAFARSSPLGRWRVVSNFMLVGPGSRLPSREVLASEVLGAGRVAGVADLPDGAGYAVRCLADDAIAARTLAERIFALSVESALGAVPAPRRK